MCIWCKHWSHYVASLSTFTIICFVWFPLFIYLYLFSFQVRWPLSIVVSRKSLTKYQLIFRFLFHCKHVDRQLCGAWQVHQVCSGAFLFWPTSISLFLLIEGNTYLQGVRSLKIRGTAISRSSLLCRSMLKFINSLLHYLTFEVGFTFHSCFLLS